MGVNSKPAKRVQKVKGTHTVSLLIEKTIYVSSALNACQAFDFLVSEQTKIPGAKGKSMSTLSLHARHWSQICYVLQMPVRRQ